MGDIGSAEEEVPYHLLDAGAEYGASLVEPMLGHIEIWEIVQGLRPDDGDGVGLAAVEAIHTLASGLHAAILRNSTPEMREQLWLVIKLGLDKALADLHLLEAEQGGRRG